ncbi:MAG TPA: response regulator [Chitinophagaceae bacterium]|nr:response regulator [Chitinophagaceae bacterium]
MKSGPIIAIENDVDDKEVFEDILNNLEVANKLIWFDNCDAAFGYLKTTTDQPFIIFCDVNVPGLSGMQFKRQIDEDHQLRKKSIPFVFYSTSVDQKTVNEAYTHMTVQGFFQKENSIGEMTKTVRLILDYWNECKHPNTK